MEWRDPSGRVQEMSARVALQRLEESGHIVLPAPRPCAATQEAVVLAVQDTTSLNYTGLREVCQGLGAVGTVQRGALGLIIHDTVTFTPPACRSGCSLRRSGRARGRRSASGVHPRRAGSGW